MTVVFAALLATAQAVSAQTEWKTIHVGGRRDFTLDIPAAVYQMPPNKTMLMGYSGTADDDAIACLLSKDPYSKKMNRAAFTAALADERRTTFCSSQNQAISNYRELDSSSTTSNGYPASTCASSFTKSGDEGTFGHINAALAIAAPDNGYDLFCDIRSANQDNAETHWVMFWKDQVTHIQASLHLPRRGK